jgi:nucleotide-binding universal stress UspA family protein
MILISYDGSVDSRAAVEHAAELFADEPTTVLTVWEPFAKIIGRTAIGFGFVPMVSDAEEIDEANRKGAEERAEEGADLARKAGMSAQSMTCAESSTTARAILAAADELEARAIVMGSRGLTGVKSILLGSVSHEVIQNADRTVVVVPSPEVARARARTRHAIHEPLTEAAVATNQDQGR